MQLQLPTGSDLWLLPGSILPFSALNLRVVSCCVAPQPLRWRLQLERTVDTGWGVITWDVIPDGAFVGTYTGKVVMPDSLPVPSDLGGCSAAARSHLVESADQLQPHRIVGN